MNVVSFEEDIAAIPTVSTGRSAEWNVLGAAERDATVSAVPSFDEQGAFIDEPHGPAL